jgi:hypothetical protein
MFCIGKGRKPPHKNCVFKVVPSKNVCSKHEYLEKYSSDELARLDHCTRCGRYDLYSEKHVRKCDVCDKTDQVRKAHNNATLVKCGYLGCKSKDKENGYCGKHQLQIFIDQTKEKGLKVCSNVARGCRAQLELTDRASCRQCLDKAIIKDKQLRQSNYIQSQNIVDTKTQKICTTCLIPQQNENFIGQMGQETKTCAKCRQINQVADSKRQGRVRDYKSYLLRPEVIERRKQWRIQNHDKLVSYYSKYRFNQLQNDPLTYRKRNADRMREYVATHREKFEGQSSIYYNTVPLSRLNAYKASAKSRGIDWSLDDQMALQMFGQNCFYCGTGVPIDGQLNGIDRLDNSSGYEAENCVACCKTCNNIKGCLEVFQFVEICSHIIQYQYDNSLYCIEMFPDTIASSYSQYKQRAIKKLGTLFELSKLEFDEIIENPCYICGKQNSTTHQNGIDRYNNDNGYIIDNCRSCCYNCNIIKKTMNFDDFIDILLRIVFNNQVKEVLQESIKSVSITKPKLIIKNNIASTPIVTYNRQKLTREERKEHRIIKLENSRQKSLELHASRIITCEN